MGWVSSYTTNWAVNFVETSQGAQFICVYSSDDSIMDTVVDECKSGDLKFTVRSSDTEVIMTR